ncbi:zinc finger CCCH domain-containing protein 11A-like [Carassius carassius]|uniref:zinc finger CCCH domain-containing protein 11A-like n=1 Tax=Carassius carassius TaxID=217509 RepID=UPI0028683C55|nr:zinc finger CCCH domain-containing protein 11A-like [Carassius carassius]XP_059385466.1 zinc finger CCCH domain-containing protein 11A-like [Carassius carassius]XP_059385467.1 zinc finger CCCH domain-containing protein 11A-like [Carassius carassius]XP_059385468.1 zinc finger CCCH domain-containing protein 11A-like [Carassius carassius]XP_059385469.1 zinc finger CCCH domain-containing protein 11A-like [Carassius carassius]
MTMQGDDCYFYYYSTCTKGDSCPFRHCEAAMGSETVCTLWQEQRCFRNICMFRHMEIKKNRKEIACYWENQPAGCQKAHCAFHHEKPRVIDGSYFAPDKGQVVRKEKEEAPYEDQVNLVSVPTANPANPQLRGVIRTETQENVPSPTHPPVVINPVDDDDEDDQFSEEGDESLGGSPWKMITGKNDSLNFGIQTLEEIRLRKALMASLKKSEQSTMQSSAQNKGTAIEKENIQSLSHLEVNNASIDSSVNEIGRRKITDRLGERILKRDASVEEDLPLKRRLAERLGRTVESSTDVLPQKAQKPVRERLGLTAAPPRTDSEPKSSGDIHIKTLEEIRQEKAARNLSTSKVVPVVKEVSAKELSPSKKSVRPAGRLQVKTFSEILHEKKKIQEKKAKDVNTTKSTDRNEGPSTTGAAVKAHVTVGEVRVKTLEEIRREKTARMQAQLQELTDDKTQTSTEAEASGPPKRRILRINKSSPTAYTVGQTKPDVPDKKLEPPAETNGKGKPSSETVKVKTFEEIMREKRLRKLQEEQVTSTTQKDAGLSEPAASPPASDPSDQPQTTVRQRIALKHKSSPLSAAVVPQKSSPERSGDSSPSTNKPKPSSSPVIPIQLAEGTIHIETKVKPKVNVKPSVVKPAAQPTQKRKTAKNHSAVAEVKPLNTAHQTPSSLVIPNKRLKVVSPGSQEVQSNTRRVPSNTEDIQMVPTSCVEPASTTSPAIIAVPQIPVIKTPSMQRSRRPSTTSGRTPAVTSSSVDDFEELLGEFTDDRLEDELELDSGKGEDDLLLELSEMIDS